MIISQLVYECRCLETQGFIPSKVAAELYVGDSLAMIREAGGMTCKKTPRCKLHQPIFERLAN